MRQSSLIALSLLAFLTGGCQLFGGGEPETTEPTVVEPISETSPNATPAATPTANGEATEPFTEPTVAGNVPPPPASIPSDLIASTNSASRLQQIEGKGADPFAPLSVTPIVTIPPSPPSAPATQAPSPNTARTSPPGTTASQPTPAPTPAPPPPPRTVEAKGVEVTGVVQVGSQVFAIVKAPGEPTSRYVQAGQSLANGQVFIKRIDVSSAEPVVVLVQNGVEVKRLVGSPVQTAEAQTANLAMYTPPL